MKRFFENLPLAMALMLIAVVLNSCSEEDNAIEPQPEQPVYNGTPLVILDTDIGSSTDDLFVMDMLYKYEQQGKLKVLGVVVNREGCGDLADVMNTYYGRGDVPVGVVKNGLKAPKVWIDYRDMASYKDEEGNLLFKTSVEDYSKLPDGWQLYRKLLASQPDGSVTICSIGFLPCLSQLLESGPDEYSTLNGVELVRQKVKKIYLMGGVFGNAVEPDYNFLQGIDFSLTFFELWPKEIDMVFSPGEVGDAIEYLPNDVISDISWTDINPLKQVYKRCNCDTGQKMWDQMALIPICDGDELYTMSERGIVTLSEKGETTFTATPTGNARYQLPGTDEWAQMMPNPFSLRAGIGLALCSPTTVHQSF